MAVRSHLSFLSSCLFVLGLAACGTAQTSSQDTAGNTFCFGCHSETSDLGKKILWAQAGYGHSVHLNGQIDRIYVSVPLPAGVAGSCAPFPDTACYVPTGTEFDGSNAFYANSGGCQMCHTHEGFRKRVSGQYDPPDGSYSIKFSWDTRAQVGSPTTTPNTPLTADVIVNPSPVGCFTCHTPHGIGTADGEHLDQTIPVGTTITTQTGAVWGANKQKGHMCAECHEIRLNQFATTSDSIVASIKGTGTFSVSAPYGPHHGPQTDVLLGKGGAEYKGTAGAFTFAGTYSNSPHTAIFGADCISCHMQDDFSDINVTGSFGVNAAVGGHAMSNKGFVHGAEKALVIGCGSTGVDAQGNPTSCHTAPGVATSKGNFVQSASITKGNEYLQNGDAFFQKFNGTTNKPPSTDSNYHLKVNELLAKLATPSKACAGLLMDAAVVAGGAIGWATMVDGVTTDPRCISAGSTKPIAKDPNAADDNTNASVRFLKGLWNFKLVLAEDKSFGVHNTTYELKLLYDSCTDLALLSGKDCGSTPGRCSFCEGTNVTARP
jgi:hypothetical protein